MTIPGPDGPAGWGWVRDASGVDVGSVGARCELARETAVVVAPEFEVLGV
jgi:hypothetical protein